MNTMQYELSHNWVECPRCHNIKFSRFKGLSLDLVGYCYDCHFCLTPFEYHVIQKRLIASFDESRYASLLQNGVEPNGDDYPWVLDTKNITASLKDNVFIKFLESLFAKDEVERVATLYGLETQKKSKTDAWHGAVVFYQYDTTFKQIAYKIMQYSEQGERIKNQVSQDETSEIEGTNERKTCEKDLVNQASLRETGKYCFFGLHQISFPTAKKKIVCIVESEKTAIICSIIYPKAIWLAAGGCYYLSEQKMKDLEEIPRNSIILFPDADVYGEQCHTSMGESDWYKLAKTKEWLNGVRVNDFVRSLNKKEITDLADYIIDAKKNQKDILSFEKVLEYEYKK